MSRLVCDRCLRNLFPYTSHRFSYNSTLYALSYWHLHQLGHTLNGTATHIRMADLSGLCTAPMYGTASSSLSSKTFLYFIAGGTGRCVVNVLETGLFVAMWLVLKCNVKSIVDTESPVT
jgi:hypothetical protein